MAEINNKYIPNTVFYPGLTLAEKLEEMGMSQKVLALRMGRPEKTISEIIKGKTSITPETASQLETVLQIPSHLWLQMETDYQEYLQKEKEKEELEDKIEVLNEFPIKTMRNYNWLPNINSKVSTLKALYSFLGVANEKGFEKYWQEGVWDVAYRKSMHHTLKKENALVWLRHGEMKACETEVGSFSQSNFKEALMNIRSLTNLPISEAFPKVKNYCSDAGVHFIFTPQIPKTFISGACRWINNNPLIQISSLYKTDDHFWFTFFHEAGHLLKHSRKNIFIDLEKIDSKDELEREANEFACDTLIPKINWEDFIRVKQFSEKKVTDFAEDMGINPSIVVGRLQHSKLLKYTHLNKLKKKVDIDPAEA